MKQIHWRIAVTGLCALLAGVAGAADVPWLTGFEADEGFTTGNLDGQGGWFVETGASAVQNASAAHGAQAIRLDPGATVGVAVTGVVGSVVWVDTWVSTDGTDNVPVLDAMDARSSVVYFSTVNGAQPLDGDGSGGGVFLALSPPATVSSTEWHRITLRQDYSARSWDFYFDGVLRASSLGFKDDSVDRLHGLRQYSEETAYLDSVSATTAGLDNDADADSIVDLDEIKIHGTDPDSPDTDGDGSRDGDELIAGTSPTDSSSAFRSIVSEDGTSVSVTFNTESGRTYTVQYATDLEAGDWTDVADASFVDLAGTGGIFTYVETPVPLDSRYYRVVVRD